ncbi:MAG: conjugative transposon protein TraM [Weeksellaceae bacterium]|nr:conjugative transposon protein TraM [Acholeplasmataceae bacterium]
MKRINFKEKRYVFPLIALPVWLFLGYQFISASEKKAAQQPEQTNVELSTGLGEVTDSILNKNDAYDKYYQKRIGDLSMFQNLEEIQEEKWEYSDNYDDRQKQIMDSLKQHYEMLRQNINQQNTDEYNLTQRNYSQSDDYQRQTEILNLLNQGNKDASSTQPDSEYKTETKEEEYDPIKQMREQLLFLDSLEKSKDPEFIAQKKAEEKLIKDKKRLEEFLNSTLTVKKATENKYFNTISSVKSTPNIMSIIDENTTGYLGSRIRLKLLEEIYVGDETITTGTIMYANITGFNEQRVFLNVLSIVKDDVILPVNLSVYDLDGMRGLYVPSSNFREMMKEMGGTTVQGQQLETSEQNFTSSVLTGLFTSTSKSIAQLIRKNKAKLKYNSHIYLINEKKQ